MQHREKEKKEREKNSKIEKPKELGHLVHKLSCHASGKKGKLSCCKCIFDQIKANLAEVQPQNHQNVQKTHFWQKASGANGLNLLCFCTSHLAIPWNCFVKIIISLSQLLNEVHAILLTHLFCMLVITDTLLDMHHTG